MAEARHVLLTEGVEDALAVRRVLGAHGRRHIAIAAAVTHYGEGEPLARRMLAAERRAGNRARLRRWTPEVVDADELYDLAEAVPVPRPAGGLDDTIPF